MPFRLGLLRGSQGWMAAKTCFDPCHLVSLADVALYHSILLEQGMAAMLWLMDNHISFNQTLKDLFLRHANLF